MMFLSAEVTDRKRLVGLGGIVAEDPDGELSYPEL